MNVEIGFLIVIALVIAGWLAVRGGALTALLRPAIERRLGGYRQIAVRVDPSRPRELAGRAPRVAVIGGGLAGISAAATLGERGFDVVLIERNHYLGGKVGAWTERIDGVERSVEHGFHAFFRQYYNLNAFLDRLGLRAHFRAIEDYVIIDANHRELRFGDVDTTPAINIVGLGQGGFFRWRDVLGSRTRERLDRFVRFDMEPTYAALDGVTFKQFCDDAALPAELRVAFRTFARAFFSDEADLSTADVLRAFHFYYLSHDQGLMYDFPDGDYETTLLRPIRDHLEQVGVEIRLSSPIKGIERGSDTRFRIDGEEVDWVIMAADIPGAQEIFAGSAWLREVAPTLSRDIMALRTSHGYAVWRIWVDKDVRAGLPTFINVDRQRVLDSVTLYHRVTDEAREWVEAHGGAVLELHSYALPKNIGGEDEIRRVFLEELGHYFPELAGLAIAAETLQVRRDFPAFAPGQRTHRPDPKTAVDGLLIAGDWVRLPYPMTHMEAAFTSGLVCANVLFDAYHLQRAPIETVAPKGLLRAKARAA